MATRSMRFWSGPLSPGELDRLYLQIARKIMHPPELRPQRRKHRRPVMA